MIKFSLIDEKKAREEALKLYKEVHRQDRTTYKSSQELKEEALRDIEFNNSKY